MSEEQPDTRCKQCPPQGDPGLRPTASASSPSGSLKLNMWTWRRDSTILVFVFVFVFVGQTRWSPQIFLWGRRWRQTHM